MIHPDNGILNAIKGSTLYTDLEGSPRRIVKKKKNLRKNIKQCLYYVTICVKQEKI